jgi:hypothetical protein
MAKAPAFSTRNTCLQREATMQRGNNAEIWNHFVVSLFEA